MTIPKRAFSVLFVNTFMSIVALDGCSTDNHCFHFQDVSSWNEEYLTSICVDDGATDKSMNASLCAQFEDNLEYEKSLKLAILNQMYGTGNSPTLCPDWCMYDPLNVAGLTAVSFRWNNINACWMVNVGATSPLCNVDAGREWAISKTANWCCTSGPTNKPISSPPQTLGGQPTIMPSQLPTLKPSPLPTLMPTTIPSPSPSSDPTKKPVSSPLPTPGGQPTIMPSQLPTLKPSPLPTLMPTTIPSPSPSSDPTKKPVSSPLPTPGGQPTIMPTIMPSLVPTLLSRHPTKKPSSSPLPTPGGQFTIMPTIMPSRVPTLVSLDPTKKPTSSPPLTPGGQFTIMPSLVPTLLSLDPTQKPTSSPPPTLSGWPTIMPTPLPTLSPIDGMLCSTDNDCYQFQDLASWNQEYVTSLCNNYGNTDKSMSATLCNAYAGNLDYENSLKLAILNTMYGTGPIASRCPQWCMYDPYNIVGDTAVAFKWNNQQDCWIVSVGHNPLCHEQKVAEWAWAYSKTQNWCCPSDPTPEPTNSPLPLSESPTRSPTNDMLCSADDDCYQFTNLDSWNEEYVTSLCVNHGNTDKSTTATLCASWAGNIDYENSLKLAILNTMYGLGPSSSQCPYWCMYDPLNIVGLTAVGFKWKNSQSCWNVLIGASNSLCYGKAVKEFEWAVLKSQNWCCESTAQN